MARYSSEHKEATRQSILREAAGELRRSGPDKVSVAHLMRKAGLTHGGFYAHFPSKEVLLGSAIEWMFDDRGEFLRHLLEKYGNTAGLNRYIDHYLSPAHCAHPESGCPVPSLSTDVGRLSTDIRSVYYAGLQQLLAYFSAAVPDQAGENKMLLAQSALNEMAGCVMVVRSLPDNKKASSWLNGSRQSVKAHLHLN